MNFLAHEKCLICVNCHHFFKKAHFKRQKHITGKFASKNEYDNSSLVLNKICVDGKHPDIGGIKRI
jgi:hypothetical protein